LGRVTVLDNIRPVGYLIDRVDGGAKAFDRGFDGLVLDGDVVTCEPADRLPLTQRYML
jgi:hypothetical protein